MNEEIKEKTQTLRPFTRLCMTIGQLPSSYVESMSYYEQIIWFTKYLQEQVIPAVNQNAAAVEELQGLYLELQDYVNNYFNNLDVQEEINNKLDEMALNGIFDDYFKVIFQQVDNVEQNYRNKDVLIGMDDLTQEVKTAMTGGSVAVVGTGAVNTANVVDGAINYKKVTDNILLSQNLKYFAKTYNGDKFIYNFTLSHLTLSNTGNTTGISNSSLTTQILAPTGNVALKVIHTPRTDVRYILNKYTRGSKPEDSIEFTNEMFELGGISQDTGLPIVNENYMRTVDYLTEGEYYYIDNHFFIVYLYTYDLEGNIISRTTTNEIVVDGNYKYKLAVGNGTPITSDNKSYVVQQINTIFLDFVENMGSGANNDITLPYNANYVYLLRMTLGGISPIPNLPLTTDLNEYILLVDNVTTQGDYPIINKKFSVLGDSFSAYAGDIPSGNASYYNGSNAGVTSVNDMWYQHLVNDNLCTKLVINGWSGSSVSSINASQSNVPMSDTSRCQNLSKNSVDPEMIIIMGGTNDFSHANPNIGTYNGLQSFPTTNNDFRSAYALMIQRIREEYPLADIFCCGLPLFVRTPQNKYVPQQNGEPQTALNYSEAIKEIAGLMNCQFIDLNKCGFTPLNYYPTYCEDSETRPTHPNALGHAVIGKVIGNAIAEFYKNKKVE